MYSGKAISVTLLDNGIAEMIFNLAEESVNKFNVQTVLELSEAITAIETSPSVKGVLISSAKPVFIVGADITEFLPLFDLPQEQTKIHLSKNVTNFNKIEDLSVPVVVAINGFAMGGGLELALACDYRIMSESAKIGLPETKLGLIPGWCGTVRLPRIAGVDTAIDWIASAKEQRAQAALKAGVVDGVVALDKLRACAMSVLQDCIDGALDYQGRRQQKKSAMQISKMESTMAFETAKAFVAAKAGKHYPAPIMAIECMQKSHTMDRDAATEVESEGFMKMLATDTAKSLVGLFLSDQLLMKKAKKWQKKASKPIQNTAVLGAGTMGGGIAYQSAVKGVPIIMKDIAQAGLSLGMQTAAKLLVKKVNRGFMSTEKMASVLSAIRPTLGYDGFTDVDLVVEAVIEKPNVKKAVLSEVEALVSKETILTSNTSTISINLLASELQRPEQFCGMHFFNPVHAMPLVEVIRGEKTNEQTIAATVAYAAAMGKKPVVVKDCPGFLVNRVLFPYFSGFMHLVKEGADFQFIDKVMENWGLPMGPAYLLDVVGIDVAHHAEQVMQAGFPDRMTKKFVTAGDALFEQGYLGQKQQKGFYLYEKDKRGKPKKTAFDEAYNALKPICDAPSDFDKEDIIARMMIPMATESARCLEEGIVESASEADMALIYGVGFPPFRGGVFKWLDSIGMPEFLKMCERYKHLGKLYEPTEQQLNMAKTGLTYY